MKTLNFIFEAAITIMVLFTGLTVSAQTPIPLMQPSEERLKINKERATKELRQTAPFGAEFSEYLNADNRLTSMANESMMHYRMMNRYIMSPDGGGEVSVYDMDRAKIEKRNGHSLLELINTGGRVAFIAADEAGRIRLTPGEAGFLLKADLLNKIEDFIRSREDVEAMIYQTKINLGNGKSQQEISYCIAPKSLGNPCPKVGYGGAKGDPMNTAYFDGSAKGMTRAKRDKILKINEEQEKQLKQGIRGSNVLIMGTEGDHKQDADKAQAGSAE